MFASGTSANISPCQEPLRAGKDDQQKPGYSHTNFGSLPPGSHVLPKGVFTHRVAPAEGKCIPASLD